MAHFKAILRRFNKVTQSSNEGVMAPLSRWVFGVGVAVTLP